MQGVIIKCTRHEHTEFAKIGQLYVETLHAETFNEIKNACNVYLSTDLYCNATHSVCEEVVDAYSKKKGTTDLSVGEVLFLPPIRT